MTSIHIAFLLLICSIPLLCRIWTNSLDSCSMFWFRRQSEIARPVVKQIRISRWKVVIVSFGVKMPWFILNEMMWKGFSFLFFSHSLVCFHFTSGYLFFHDVCNVVIRVWSFQCADLDTMTYSISLAELGKILHICAWLKWWKKDHFYLANSLICLLKSCLDFLFEWSDMKKTLFLIELGSSCYANNWFVLMCVQ